MRRVLALATAVLALAASREAFAAPTVDECIAASDAAQTKRDEGRYREARAHLRVCTSDACPAIVRKNCDAWRAQVEAAEPSVVFSARGAGGAAATAISVELDGALIAERLTGTPVAVDPGERRFVFRSGSQRVEKVVLVVAGQKNQLVEVSLGPSAPASEPPAPPTVVVDGPSGPPLATWILGGVGAAGVGTFAVLGLTTKAELRALERAPCAVTKTCDRADEDAIRTRFLAADIALGVGVVAFAAAAWVWVAAPRGPRPVAWVSPGGVGAGVSGVLP